VLMPFRLVPVAANQECKKSFHGALRLLCGPWYLSTKKASLQCPPQSVCLAPGPSRMVAQNERALFWPAHLF
jgi:hypothetical protein